MTFLLFQAFLLTAAAYFLGAFVGCWWRRTFYAPVEMDSVQSSREAVTNAGTATSPGALNVARFESIPVQPYIEYVEAPDTIIDRNRFERALSGVGSLAESQFDGTDEAGEPAHWEEQPSAESQIGHFQVEPRESLSGHEPPEPPPTESPFGETSHSEPEPVAATVKMTDDAVAAAAAAAVAAAASRSPVGEVTPPAELGATERQHQTPPLAASGGMAGVAADVRVPPLMPADSQDLKLIRDISADVERTLHGLGVWRYADIARWGRDDVGAVNAAVGAQARVQRENWIEQAAVLAKGGLTAYARRHLRGESVNAFPTDTARPAHKPSTNAPGHATQAPPVEPRQPRTPSQMALAAAAGVAAASASASRGRTASAGARPPTPIRAPRPAFTSVTEPPHVPEPGPAPVPPVAAMVPAPSPSTPQPSAGAPAHAMPDLLRRIRGVDGHVEHLLHDSGVMRFEQIAAWTVTEVEYFDELMEQPGRVNRENWIEQAQILAHGGSTLFSRHCDSGSVQLPGGAAAMAAAAAFAATSVPGEPRAVRPSRLADAMRQNLERVPAGPTHEAPEARSPATHHDVTGLRSVRSEALRNDRFGGPTHPVDDLKRIRGVGVLIEKKLNSIGIASYDQIANWTADDIAHVSEILDFRGRIERENWVEQARILCAGGQTEFSRRIDRGEGS